MVKLIELITSKPRMKILEFLFANPSKEFSQSNLISKLGIAKPTGIKALNHLEKNGLVLTKRIGKTKLYRLNQHDFLCIQLKRIFNLTSGQLLEFVKSLKDSKKIIVFGSYARGEDTENSDIDIIVVTDRKEEEVQKIARNISRKYGRRTSVITLTPEDFVRMPEKNRELWERAILQGVTIYEA